MIARFLLIAIMAITLPVSALANQTYVTDDDNENNAGTGTPDNDMDSLVALPDANHPIEFNINVTGALPTTSAMLAVTALDVDEEIGETDEVFINGTSVGFLIGEEAKFTTTTFDVAGLVNAGDNLIQITVPGGGTSLNVSAGYLLVDGGASADADITEVSISNYNVDAGNIVTLSTEVDIDFNATGTYRTELNFIDPSGNLQNQAVQVFIATSGVSQTRTFSPSYVVFEPTGTYTLELLLYSDDGTTLVLEEVQRLTFDHEVSTGPLLRADPLNSTLVASSSTLVADNATTATLDIQAIDVGGNTITYGGDTIILTTTAGTISPVTDNGDGTYTATLQSPTTVGNTTITGTINGEAMSASVDIEFIPGPANISTSTLELGATTLFADGTSTTSVTIQAFDQFSNALTNGGDNVTVSTTDGTLTNVSDLGNGTYTAILTSSTDIVTATITAFLNGSLILDTETINFITGPASTETSTLSVNLSDIYADGSTASIITFQAIDIGNNPLAVGGDAIGISSNVGTMGPVTDNNDGTYTAVLRSSTIPSTSFITATIDGAQIDDTASVNFVEIPTTNTLITNTATPTLTGTISLITSANFSVGLNNQTYIPGDGNLTIIGNQWTLVVPLANALSEGTYSVSASVTDSSGQTTTDTSSSELTLDLTPPTVSIDTLVPIDGLNTLSYTVSGRCTDIGDTLTITVTDTEGGTVSSSALACADDGIGQGIFSSNLNLAPLLDGDVTASVLITDIAGNQASISSTIAKDSCQPSDEVTVCDSDSDSIPNGIERANGLNPASNDSDGDGISDEDEFGTDLNNPFDTDGDGVIDALDTDSDNDGILDSIEVGPTPFSPVDSDGDGTLDFQDRDSDNDFIPDTIEYAYAHSDPDSDNIPNYIDKDSDGDGIPDALEIGTAALLDSDGDGIDNNFDTDRSNGQDSNLDRVDDSARISDADRDGLFDAYDIDSDNDGIGDTIEANLTLTDSDSDGIIDQFDVDVLANTDSNDDGIIDGSTLVDTDGDGVPDFRDLDSDNDAFTDVIESGGIDTSPQDAFIDDAVTTQGTTTSPRDTDSDSIPDHLDLESNNFLNNGNTVSFDINAHPDAIIADANGDGRVDNTNDADGDGIGDFVDETPFYTGSYVDYDNDGIANRDDLDDDNDSLLDTWEGRSLVDTDGDGWTDNTDLDSDNDGITDLTESQIGATDANNDGIIDLFTDTDNNGIDDRVDQALEPADTDGDNTPDFQDLDSDNDGVFDLIEVNPTSIDFSFLDSNNDGRIDNIVNRGSAIIFYIPIDTDGDGTPDYLDVDSDGDGIRDGDENGDFNGDGENDRVQSGSGKIKSGGQGAGTIGPELFLMLIFCMMLMIKKRYIFLYRKTPNNRKISPNQNTTRNVVSSTVFLLLSLYLYAPPTLADNSLCGLIEKDSSVAHVRGFQPCFYVTFGAGASYLDPDGTSNGWSVESKYDVSADLGLGWQVSPHWFAELKYAYLGEVSLENTNPTLDDEALRYSAPSFMVGYSFLPETRPLNGYVKVGAAKLAISETDDSISVDTESNVQAAFSAGLRYRLNQSAWFTAIEFNSYAKDAAALGLQIGYYFGQKQNKRQLAIKKDIKKTSSADSIDQTTDTDGDGVFDHIDLCPLSKSGEKVDEKGCCTGPACRVTY